VLTLLVVAAHCGGCSYRMAGSSALAPASLDDVTGSIPPTARADDKPTDSDLAFTRNAASDVLTRGDKNASQPWENPQTGARGSVTPLAAAYSTDGRTCRDFLASFVKGETESWLEGEACQEGEGRWEIKTMRPWRRN
jgi:surface antigen